MEASKSNRFSGRSGSQAGFSMIEMLIATAILAVGLLSLAGLMSKMDLTTHQSRYKSTAALLCSEKLEELSAFKNDSLQIDLGTSHSVGSLTADVSRDVEGDTVGYFDTVMIGATNGTISETIVDANGEYATVKQEPNGKTPEQTVDSEPPVLDGTVTFKRRWLIEDNLSGLPTQVRRITVRVEFPTETGKMSYFQMSMVRNGKAQQVQE